MPDFSVPTEHESLIIQHMALILTSQFVDKVIQYMNPKNGINPLSALMALTQDVLVTTAMAMEMSKPPPDVPKGFNECMEKSLHRISQLMEKGLAPEMQNQFENNLILMAERFGL